MIGRGGGASTVVSAPTMVDRWLAFDRCPPATTTSIDGGKKRLAAFGCGDGTEVVFVTIDGWGGHTWPSSPVFDASRASAEFFAAHGG